MKLITKMTVFSAALVAMMLLVVATSYMNLVGTSRALSQIGSEDIPLTISMASITAGQLSQSAWLERSLLAAELDDEQALANAQARFDRNHVRILAAADDAQAVLTQAIAASDGQLRAEWTAQQASLARILELYAQYHGHGTALLDLLTSADILAAETALAMARAQSESLSAAILEMSTRVTDSATADAAQSIRVSNSAVILLGVIGFLVIIFSIGLSIAITRSVLGQLGADPAELETIADHLASGQLDIETRTATSGVALSIANTVTRLKEVIAGIQRGAEEVSLASTQLGQGNSDLSRRTQEQASSLEEIAASMEEMTSTVNLNAENADQARQLAVEATSKADQGGDIAERAVTAMSDISDASRRIAEIINVIDEISFQINLLALNAAVEAARAGEQGRGFAVVAGEVRNLAGRSATAAKEIKELIKDSVAKVEVGTELVGESGARLLDIMSSIKRVSDNVAEIAAASLEQSEGISQVNRSIVQMDEMTQQNASLVDEANAASESVEGQAAELRRLVAFFKLGDEAPAARARTQRPQAERQPTEPRYAEQARPETRAADRSRSLPRPFEARPAHRADDDALALDGDWKEF
ncbi:MAG TPA: methyl-accepting chemotaxis protein [Pseudomonadales bacterium]|nr:methyl-accepting chemotaxis protein [Pseudomonadales bacterium]